MKKLLAITAAAAIMAMAGTAMAADLTVTASIVASCTVSDGAIAFGALDPLTALEVTAPSSGVEVTCTNGTPYTLSTTANKGSAGNPGTLTSGGNIINYTIAFVNGTTGTGTGLPVAVPITGTIPADSYNEAPPGTYSDTIVLNVTP